MKKTETVTKEMVHENLLALVCDRCGKEEEYNPYAPAIKAGIQSFGYATENHTLRACELCVECIDEVLGDYLRVLEVPGAANG